MDTYRKAIEKAEANGYKGHLKFLPFIAHKIPREYFSRNREWTIILSNKWEILFDHEFWKVLHKSFDPPRCNPSGYPYTWKYYLTEFALSTDREAYLKDLLKSMEDNEKESKNKR